MLKPMYSHLYYPVYTVGTGRRHSAAIHTIRILSVLSEAEHMPARCFSNGPSILVGDRHWKDKGFVSMSNENTSPRLLQLGLWRCSNVSSFFVTSRPSAAEDGTTWSALRASTTVQLQQRVRQDLVACHTILRYNAKSTPVVGAEYPRHSFPEDSLRLLLCD